MPILDPTLIRVDVEEHLRDCPPWDEPVDEALIPEFAAEIARRFDYTEVYDQLDRLGCQVLREHRHNSILKGRRGGRTIELPNPFRSGAALLAIDVFSCADHEWFWRDDRQNLAGPFSTEEEAELDARTRFDSPTDQPSG